MLMIADSLGKRISETQYLKATLTEMPTLTVSRSAQHGLTHAFGHLDMCWPPLGTFVLCVGRNNNTSTRSI